MHPPTSARPSMFSHVARRVLTAGAVTLACCSLPAALSAQEREPLRVWLAGGVGPGLAGGEPNDDALAGTVQLAAQKGAHQFTLRLAGVAGMFSSTSSVTDLGVLYGRAVTTGFVHASASAGVALAGTEDCEGDAACGTRWGVGIPLAAEVALRPLPVFGIGVQLFADVSTVGSMLGIIGMVQLGWMP